jgi:hypothetical protein
MVLPAISTNGQKLLVTNLGLGRTFRGLLILPIGFNYELITEFMMQLFPKV